MAIYLLALIPPSNIAREVHTLQRTLFSRWGLTSALALPAHIPLGFSPADAQIPPETELQRASLTAPMLTCTRPVAEQDVFFWPVTSRETIRSFTERVENLTGPLGRPPGSPFPPFPGFYLASCQSGVARKGGPVPPAEVLSSLETPADLHFPAMMLSCLKLNSAISPEPQQWWQGILWEEIRRVRLRKTGKRRKPKPAEGD